MLSTVSADHPSSPVVAIPPQRRMPVGARFHHTWPVLDVDWDTPVSRPERYRASVFPAGCRFPRRTVADVLTYLAAVPAAPSANRASMPPVGARFPRRPRPTTAGTVATPGALAFLLCQTAG